MAPFQSSKTAIGGLIPSDGLPLDGERGGFVIELGGAIHEFFDFAA